jgi:hypothetical protein
MSAISWRRVITVALLIPAGLALGVPSASAHGASPKPIPDAAHYLTQITGITPATAGISASIDPRGEWIEVSNNTAKTLTVLGYAREPYLRVAPEGVSENSYSPTLALNQSLFGDISQLGDSSLPANWRQTGTAHQIRWHDHRIHWMGASRPPAVQAHPGVAQLIGQWTIHMTLDRRPLAVTGTLSWLPMKQGAKFVSTSLLILDVVAFGGIVAGAVLIIRWRRRRSAPDDGPDSGWSMTEPGTMPTDSAAVVSPASADRDVPASVR